MAEDVAGDHLAIIRIEGMHCHRCEQTIQKALKSHPGVHEVEVDYPSRQASVLFDKQQVTVQQLMDSITDAGYRTTGFTQRQTDRASHPK
jgi:copper chaperone CopZ